MIFIEIKNFKCKFCGCEEYSLIDNDNIIVVCDNCGEIVDKSKITVTKIDD